MDDPALAEEARIAQAFYAKIREDIRVYGQSLIAVAGKKVKFSYTVGNAEKQLPELLLLEVDFPQARTLLNLVGTELRGRKRAFKHGELVSLGGKQPVKVVEADAVVKSGLTIQVGRYYGHQNYRVLQLLVPDARGLYPGDRECAKPYCDMPVLSLRYWEEIGTKVPGSNRLLRPH